MSILEIVFGMTSNLFVLGWLALIISMFLQVKNRWKGRLMTFGGLISPLILMAAFTTGYFLSMNIEPQGSILTYHGMLEAMSVPARTLNVWIEVMGYALLVGYGIIQHAEKNGVHKGVLTICMGILFMSGGLALIAYAALYLAGKILRPKETYA